VDSTRFVDRRQRERLVHAAVGAYLRWREQCAAVSNAYRNWADSSGDAESELAWEQYETARDTEEHASTLYAELVRRVGELGVSGHELATWRRGER
jgi:hypothetical protein